MRKKTTTTTETYNDDGKLIKRVTEIVDEDSESVLKQRIEDSAESVNRDRIRGGALNLDGAETGTHSALMEGVKANLGRAKNDSRPYRVTANIGRRTLFDDVVKPKKPKLRTKGGFLYCGDVEIGEIIGGNTYRDLECNVTTATEIVLSKGVEWEE